VSERNLPVPILPDARHVHMYVRLTPPVTAVPNSGLWESGSPPPRATPRDATRRLIPFFAPLSPPRATSKLSTLNHKP
jgi:hypothetical protein